MNTAERNRLSKEAEMQLAALKRISHWKTIALAISTIGVAAVSPDTLKGKRTCGSSDRIRDHGYEDHAGRGTRACEAHRGRRLQAGDLPGAQAGAHAGKKRALGAMV